MKERNSQETRKKILAAVGDLLARSGFRDVGINAIARQAGVDKVLIYRYFGGLQALLRAYAEEGGSWPSAEELLTAVGERGNRPDAEFAAAILIELMRAIRRRPITQEIMRWELLERNELTDALARYREAQAMRLLSLFRRRTDADLQAIASLLGAGQTYLILRSKTADVYDALQLHSEDDWRRIEDSVRWLTQLAFEAKARPKRSKDKKSAHAIKAGIRTGRRPQYPER